MIHDQQSTLAGNPADAQTAEDKMTYDACFCDYDPPEFCTVKMVKARKEHRCEECGRKIETGETYEYTFGKWDGYADYFKVCDLCIGLRNWAKISVPCFCWAYGNLHDDVRNMVDEAEHDVPGLMFEWGRRMIKIERKKYGTHWPRKRARTRQHPTQPMHFSR